MSKIRDLILNNGAMGDADNTIVLLSKHIVDEILAEDATRHHEIIMLRKDVIKERMKQNGYNGLCNQVYRCGCGIDNLAPCGEYIDLVACVPAKKRFCFSKDGDTSKPNNGPDETAIVCQQYPSCDIAHHIDSDKVDDHYCWWPIRMEEE